MGSVEFGNMLSSLFTVLIAFLQLIKLDNLANALANHAVMPIDEEL